MSKTEKSKNSEEFLGCKGKEVHSHGTPKPGKSGPAMNMIRAVVRTCPVLSGWATFFTGAGLGSSLAYSANMGDGVSFGFFLASIAGGITVTHWGNRMKEDEIRQNAKAGCSSCGKKSKPKSKPGTNQKKTPASGKVGKGKNLPASKAKPSAKKPGNKKPPSSSPKP